MNFKIFLFQVNVCTKWLAFIFPNGIRTGRVMAIINAMEYTGLPLPAHVGLCFTLS